MTGLLSALALTAAVATGWLAVPARARAGEAPAAVPDDLVELGRRLFFDPAASRLGVRSCADCHDPDHGWSDAHIRSEDARGFSRRHSQSLIDCAGVKRLHSDGEFASLEDLISSRLAATPAAGYSASEEEQSGRPTPRPPDPDGISPDFEPPRQSCSYGFDPSDLARSRFASAGDETVPEPAEVLDIAGRYREALGIARSFGSSLDRKRIVAALAAFCRSIRSGTSPYDRFAAGDTHALSASAVRGLALFRGHARCASCHLLEGKRPTFTDDEFHCTDVECRHARGQVGLRPDDEGAAVHRRGSLASFRTPSLRDVALRGPYMHDGRFATLEDAVAHYAKPLPSGPKPTLDPRMPPPDLGDDEVIDLAAFLRSLTSDETPGKAKVTWSRRASRTTLHFADEDGNLLAGREVTLVPAGGTLPGRLPPPEIRLRTDRRGTASYVPPSTTHVRLVLAQGMRPKGGTWIPDTCSEALITLPIRGSVRLRLLLPEGEPAPALLVFQHSRAQFFPERKLPTTTLTLESQVRLADGRCNAFYVAPRRTDVPREGRLRVVMPRPELHDLTLGADASLSLVAP